LTVQGVPTPIPFYRWLLDHEDFAGPSFAVHNRWVDAVIGELPKPEIPLDRVTVRVGRRSFPVALPGLATLGDRAAEIVAGLRGPGEAGPADSLVLSPMQGTIVTVAVKEGDVVAVGDLIAVLEAMKMQNPVLAAVAGTVTDLRVSVGDSVAHRQHLCEITPQG
jgi:acetyl-CoA/propionyl-CoA carboxylase biotin carboxyl carrier protein